MHLDVQHLSSASALVMLEAIDGVLEVVDRGRSHAVDRREYLIVDQF